MKSKEFLKDLYNSINDWLSSYKNIELEIKNLTLNEVDLKKSLLQLEEVYTELDSLHTYALIEYELEVNNKEKREHLRKVEFLYDEISGKTYDFNIFIEDNIERVINYVRKEKELNKFYLYYKSMFSKQDKNVNELESLYNNMDLRNYYDYLFYDDPLLCTFDHNNKVYNVYTDDLLSKLNSSDREIRKKTYVNMLKKLSFIKTHAAFTINLDYQLKNKIAHTNGFENHFDMLLQKSIFSIDTGTFNDESEIIKKLFKRTIDIRRKLLGYEYISYYDIYYLGDTKSSISYEDAKIILKNAFSIYGEEYLKILNQVFDDNWIHYENSRNKRLGARSFSSYNSHPYILMNWENDLESLFALAHEIGGAIAQYLSQQSTSILYSETSELKTEFTSFLNEITLMKHLSSNNYVFIEKEELNFKILEILKDNYLVPFEYLTILNTLSSNANEHVLDEYNISRLYNDVITSYRSFENFHDLEINKFNWIKGHEGLLVEYNLHYIEAFILASSYSFKNFDKVLNLLKYGETISDLEFFENIFGEELHFHKLNKSTFEIIDNSLNNLVKVIK